MNGEETIVDYGLIDQFINKSLKDFRSKVFGDIDDNTGYFKEYDTESDTENDAVNEGIDEGVNEGTTEDEFTEEDAYDYMFGPEFDGPNEGVNTEFTPVQGNVSFKQGVNTEGLSPRASSIINDLTKVAGDFVITSGKRTASQNSKVKGVANSFHLTGQAVDIRPNPQINAFLSSAQGRKFMADRGYEIVDERSKKGAAHWHIEPSKKQAGGRMPIARTAEEQYIGLNNESLDELVLPLQGTNPIRGLDNGKPVYIQDENGQSDILYGPDDISHMQGKVYERRLKQTGGDVTEQILWLDNWYTNRVSPNPALQKLIEKEKKDRNTNLYKPYKISNKPEDIGENNEASYTPGKRQFNLPVDFSEDTGLHEATHMSDDFRRPTYGFEDRAIKKSMPSKKQAMDAYREDDTKEDKKDTEKYFNYMSDPGEVKARLMILRKKAGFKPNQKVTDEDLQKFFDEIDGVSNPGFDDLLDFIRAGGKKDFNKKVLNLLNNTVRVNKNDSNLV